MAAAQAAKDTAGTKRGPNGAAWLKLVLIALVIALPLLLVLEMVARIVVPKIAVSGIRKELNIPISQEIEIEFQGVLLLQLATGGFQGVTVYLDDYTVSQGITGSVKASFARVAVNPVTAPLEGAKAQVTMTEKQFSQMLKTVAPDYVEKAQVRNGAVEITKTFTVFGSSVPVSANVLVGASDGQLLLTPQSLTGGGITVNPDQASQLVGGQLHELIGRFGGENKICVAGHLPRGVRLESLLARRGVLAAEFTLNQELLRDPQLQKLGSCDD